MVQFKAVFIFSDGLNDAAHLSFNNKFKHYPLTNYQLDVLGAASFGTSFFVALFLLNISDSLSKSFE